MRKESGFTLAELMIVIVIMAIASAIVIPNYIAWLPKYKLKNAVMSLVANMRSTKLEALKHNQDWAIVFDQGNNTYYICSDPGGNFLWDGPSSDDTVEKTVNLKSYNAGVRFTSASANSVTFNSRGMSTTVVVDLTGKNNSDSYRVQTSLSGGILSDKL